MHGIFALFFPCRWHYSADICIIGEKVIAKLTKNTVEIFNNRDLVAIHMRAPHVQREPIVRMEHMPPEHQKYVQWNGDRFVSWAATIGSCTVAAVKAILNSYRIEQQGYKACLGLLKLADKYTPERLESACKRAFEYTPQPSYKNIQTILASGQDKITDEPEPPSSSKYGFTRGAEYYGGRGRQC